MHTVEIDTCVWYRPYLKITSNNDCFQQKGYENINFKAAKLQQFKALSLETGRKLIYLGLVHAKICLNFAHTSECGIAMDKQLLPFKNQSIMPYEN